MLSRADRDIWFTLQAGFEMLPARFAPERILPDDEFQAFCFRNDQVQIERDGGGMIHLYPLNTIATSEANAEITAQLRGWSARSNAGKALGSSAGFFLPDGSMMCPSASVISNAKWRSLSRQELEGIPRCVPDFVIELVSRWKTRDVLLRKMPLWIGNGVSLAWLIDPDARSATVYRLQADLVTVNVDWLAGEGPMEGSQLDLREVWSCYDQGG